MIFANKNGRFSAEVQPLLKIENREFQRLFKVRGSYLEESVEAVPQLIEQPTETLLGELAVSEIVVDREN